MSQDGGSVSGSTRVLIVDDHPLYRDAVRALLSRQPAFGVCGEAGTLADARRLCEEYKPDLVLLDLSLPREDGSLPREDGLAFLEESRSWAPPPRVLVVTAASEDGPEATEAMRLGAAGVVGKQATGEQLIRVVRQVCAGQPYINEKLLGRLLRRGHG